MSRLTEEKIKELIPNLVPGTVFRDYTEAPFEIFGTKMVNGVFSKELIRVPMENSTGDGCDDLRHITTGVRIRFGTDARTLAVIGCTGDIMPFRMKNGFDIRVTYENGTIQSWHATRNGYTGVNGVVEGEKILFNDSATVYCARQMWLLPGEKEVEILFPHFGPSQWLEIGTEEKAALRAPRKYTVEKPVAFYGSSITQGISASRPASTYEAQVSHMLDCNYVNLGFSGCCKCQRPIVDYLKTLTLSAFVYDYDHNAPNCEYLQKTHEPTFLELREVYPDIPFVFMTKPDFLCNERDAAARRCIIYTTYSNALARGDRNVYFLDGETLFKKPGVDPSICTFDGCHPNDLGFWCMARSVASVLSKALGVPMVR